jgi:STE24 endopeptidase
MILTGTLGSSLVNALIFYHSDTANYLTSQPYWEALYPILLFVPFVAASALYFRFVFGYFSRLFERQADLYLYELDIPPAHMIEALDEIAHAAGGIHNIPNWHHGSIQDRIDFLNNTTRKPQLISAHHRKVRRSLAIYIILLIAFIAMIFF